MAVLYGKLAARKLYGVGELERYATTSLPAPPAECLYGTSIPQDGWGMLGNDVVGDCTIAGAAHLDMAWDAEVNESVTIPSASTAQNTYFSFTGGKDTGLAETFVLDTWMKSGLWNSKIAAYVPINLQNIESLHQAIYYYGGAYLGIQCPDSAQQQFNAGVPWTVVPGSQIDGGHCIIAVGYDQEYVDIVTWGKRVRVSYPFLQKYLEEAYAVIPSQFVAAGRGPALDLASLQADLAAVRG